ncbi:hypothetical protein TNCV_1967121 [Trichonephila clavipes]|nr:hypothetical protein TNCV_1967121 [Trichonephila clavipes]
MVQRSREKREKQQYINGTENLLLKCCTTTDDRNYDQKSSSRPDSGQHGIPCTLEDSLYGSYPLSSYIYSSDSFNSQRVSRTPNSSCEHKSSCTFELLL